jgi:KTSC domain
MKLIPIQSSMLSDAGYDEKQHELGVIFHSGGMYIYENVPQQIYIGLMKADLSGDSVGAYMHKHVIDKYPYRRPGDLSINNRRHKRARKTTSKGKVIPFKQKRDASPR